MKILFVTEMIFAPKQGAQAMASAHFETLKQMYGSGNVDLVYINLPNTGSENGSAEYTYVQSQSSKIAHIINSFSGRPYFVSVKAQNQVVRKVAEGGYDLVWFDNVYFGGIARDIRNLNPQVKIVSYSHDVQIQRELRFYYSTHNFKHLMLSIKGIVAGEEAMMQTADAKFLLTKRDKTLTEYIYSNAKNLHILPVYFKDFARSFEPNEDAKQRDSNINLLFVGSHYRPNIEAAQWFALNVMPLLPPDFRFYIVGNGLEKVASLRSLQDDCIRLIGTCEDLNDWYRISDIVVGPILSGSGMKTKVAEALMFGRPFVGTDEALVGYEQTDACIRSNTAEEFAEAIQGLVRIGDLGFSPDRRKDFERFYSSEAAEAIISSCISDVFEQGA